VVRATVVRLARQALQVHDMFFIYSRAYFSLTQQRVEGALHHACTSGARALGP